MCWMNHYYNNRALFWSVVGFFFSFDKKIEHNQKSIEKKSYKSNVEGRIKLDNDCKLKFKGRKKNLGME